jgi:dTMP kinase
VALSLGSSHGADPRAAALREELFEVAPRHVVGSLGAQGDDAAWNLRERQWARDPEGVVAHLGTLDDPRAWEMRDAYTALHRHHLDAHYVAAMTLARSVTGLDGDRAFEVRKLARTSAPIAALKSLAGLGSDHSWDWRERYLIRAPKAVMSTLVRVKDARAWRMRLAVAAECKEALDGISGMSDPAAWDLREKYADVWPSTVVKSLGPLADGSRGEDLVRRLLGSHSASLSLLKHAAGIALGAHRFSLDDEE